MPSITYTNSLPGTIIDCFPLSASLSTWSTAKVRLTESAAPNAGRWTGVLDVGDWAVFEGGTAPSGFGSSVGTITIADGLEGVVVVPVVSGIQERNGNGVIILFVDEQQPVSISVFNASLQPVDLTGLTLSLAVTDDGVEIASYIHGELTVANNAVTFIPKTAIVSQKRRLVYALRDTATNAVLALGRILVRFAPS
jgi:hypothetical protein